MIQVSDTDYFDLDDDVPATVLQGRHSSRREHTPGPPPPPPATDRPVRAIRQVRKTKRLTLPE